MADAEKQPLKGKDGKEEEKEEE